MTKTTRNSRPHTPPAHWEPADGYRPDGCLPLRPGRLFRIRGERGRFRFIRYVASDGGDWVDCVGVTAAGVVRAPGLRSIRPDRITRVHR